MNRGYVVGFCVVRTILWKLWDPLVWARPQHPSLESLKEYRQDRRSMGHVECYRSCHIRTGGYLSHIPPSPNLCKQGGEGGGVRDPCASSNTVCTASCRDHIEGEAVYELFHQHLQHTQKSFGVHTATVCAAHLEPNTSSGSAMAARKASTSSMLSWQIASCSFTPTHSPL
jgi:hypothetical protein